MPAPGPDAYDHPHFDSAEEADDWWEGQPIVWGDPDRIPTRPEGVPISNRDLVYPPETREYTEALRQSVRR